MNLLSILSGLFGLCCFAFSLFLLNKSTKVLASQKCKVLFSKVSKSKFNGVLIGAGSAVVLQSSSVATVMLVKLVDAGTVSLLSAVSIIMGANIGSTISAQLFSLNALNLSIVFYVLTFIGIISLIFSKTIKLKQISLVVVSLGLLFCGLNLLNVAFENLAKSEAIKSALISIKNPFLLLFIGLILTGVLQSSSIVSGIIICLASANLITLNSTMFLILGTNIGTCVTALLASLGSTLNGKRTAIIHLLFNVFGTMLLLTPLLLFNEEIVKFLLMFSHNPARVVANFHTIFNILATIILLPFSANLAKLSEKIVKGKAAV